ncbi:hypothetical protein [Flaviflexus sp.]|uniref:hypothetical protein n=1 Tax=Flaviflexus sp. TaxID=1969482 RepID=UPI003F8DE161
MTIQLPSSNQTRSSYRVPALSIDLSALGAEVLDTDTDFGEDFPVETCNFGRLASMTSAALTDGLAGVTLGASFLLRSDLHLRDCRLDAIRAAVKLTSRITGPIFASVTADEVGNAALDLVKDTGVGLEIHIPHGELDAALDLVRRAQDAGTPVTVALTGDTAQSIDLTKLGTAVDTVRLREQDPHTAREIRYSLRSAALEAGHDLQVVCDLFMIVSACTMDAEERGNLISAIGADRYAEGSARVLGTVHDVADHVESWLALGAGDAFTILPGSLPTDLASTVCGVLPLLHARRDAEAEAAA